MSNAVENSIFSSNSGPIDNLNGNSETITSSRHHSCGRYVQKSALTFLTDFRLVKCGICGAETARRATALGQPLMSEEQIRHMIASFAGLPKKRPIGHCIPCCSANNTRVFVAHGPAAKRKRFS